MSTLIAFCCCCSLSSFKMWTFLVLVFFVGVVAGQSGQDVDQWLGNVVATTPARDGPPSFPGWAGKRKRDVDNARSNGPTLSLSLSL